MYKRQAVDRVEQCLGEVDPGAEELHLLADLHGGDAAGDRGVVAEARAHQLVRLVLHRGGVDRHPRAELLEPPGKSRGPEDGHVRLGGRAEVVQGLQVAERRPGDQGAAVRAHAADRLGDPGRVPGEQLVVLGGAQEADDPQLDDEVVDQLLGLLLGQESGLQVALEVDVQEGRGAAQRHGGAVLLLDRRQVGEVQPLDRLPAGAGRTGEVVPVGRGHLLELAQGPDLLGEFLALADRLLQPRRIARSGVQLRLLGELGVDQPVHAVQGDPAVVADDPAAAVGVGQAGDDAGPAGGPDVGGVGVEDPRVVGLAVLGEGLLQLRVDRVAVRPQRSRDHPPAAVGHDRALERGVGLEPDDQLPLPVDPARGVCGDGGRDVVRDVVHALGALLGEAVGDPPPHLGGPLGGAGQEAGVALVGGVVVLDEVADVDRVPPGFTAEALPGRGGRGLRVRCGGHLGFPSQAWSP